FGRTVADVTDEMKMTRPPVGGLVPRSAFTEIDLAGEPLVHHPLERAVDGGAADSAVLPANEIEELICAQMSLLAEEELSDAVALGRALTNHKLVVAERLPAAARRRCVRILDREAAACDRVDEVDFGAVQISDADWINEQLDAVRLEDLVARPLSIFLDH